MQMKYESIFLTSLRSFCSVFAKILGIALALVVVFAGIMTLSGPNYMEPPSEPTIMPDAEGDRSLLSGSSPAILRIEIHGVVGMGDLTGEKIENILLDSRSDFLHGNRVKAVLLHIDTPGGTVTDANAIYMALMNYKSKYNIPIYAFVDGLCASGGMYIASAADRIYATTPSVIGSVGVILGPNFNFSQAMTQWGISALTLTEGKDKDALNPFRPWQPDEDASLRTIIKDLYFDFISIVSNARPLLTTDKLINQYGAHVFVAEEAAQKGYIDVPNSSYSVALKDLAEQAGLKEKYQVVKLSSPQPFFAGLARSFLRRDKIVHTLDVHPLYKPELSGKFLYLYVQ